MKAKAQYKAALKIQSRLQGKEDISQEEKSKLAWAEQKVEEERLYYAQLPQIKATKGEFANKVEELMATKRQCSIESAKDTPAGKRQRGSKVVIPQPTTKKPKQKAKLSDMSKRHLIVALIDRSEENGKMTAAQWEQVHAQLVESLFARMEDAPDAPMPTFDGA
ncbi:uncharacterized protein LOC121404731 [Drosophila obscura]|uniref:uncharacterized protein LOC121404731 n=1 Tax=Drosophila obscura TaxID=7282 RepID=UPI001BB1C3D5|nr:uncharacterized protein LOC121404731 [Drosophila obscura]